MLYINVYISIYICDIYIHTWGFYQNGCMRVFLQIVTAPGLEAGGHSRGGGFRYATAIEGDGFWWIPS